MSDPSHRQHAENLARVGVDDGKLRGDVPVHFSPNLLAFSKSAAAFCSWPNACQQYPR